MKNLQTNARSYIHSPSILAPLPVRAELGAAQIHAPFACKGHEFGLLLPSLVSLHIFHRESGKSL